MLANDMFLDFTYFLKHFECEHTVCLYIEKCYQLFLIFVFWRGKRIYTHEYNYLISKAVF